MDIINHIVAVPNIHAYLLLQSRGLSMARIRHVLVTISASVIGAYAVSHRQQLRLAAPISAENDALDCKVDTRALGIRLDLAPKFLGELVQLLAPGVLARMHRLLRGDTTALDRLSSEPAG